MFQHVTGSDTPRRTLIETGAFSDGWVKTYFELLEEAKVKWRDEKLWPRDLVAAVHVASLYFRLDYQVWCQHSGHRNEQTDGDLAAIRTRSELFLLTPIVKL